MGGQQHLWIRLAGVIGGALSIALLVIRPDAVDILRDRMFDQFQRLSPRAYNADPVKIVEIDDAALAKYGQWPWPRHRLAAIIDELNEAGAAAIVFDIILSEPDRTSPANVVNSWLDEPSLNTVAQALGAADLDSVDHDKQLAAAMERAPFVLHLTAQSSQSDASCVKPLEAARVQGMQPLELAQVAASFRQTVPSLPMFRQAASGEGFARAGINNDAVVRAAPLVALACDGSEIFPSLAVEAIRVAAPLLDPKLTPKKFQKAAEKGPCTVNVTGVANRSVSELILCRLRVPTTDDGRIWIHYSAPESVAARSISVVDVLGDINAVGDEQAETMRREKLAKQVAGRIVMVGASAEGLRDVLVTPLGDERPGVHIHADIVEQILAQETIYRVWGLMRPVEIVIATVVSLTLIFMLTRLSATIGFALWALLVAGLFGGAYYLFSSSRVLLDPVSPGLVLGASFIGAFVVMFQQEQMARKFIRGAFGKFLSPLILDRLEKDPSLLKLEGEAREITAFFSDIRSFTTISEQLSPQQVTTMLNQYFTPMTRIVTEHRGLVDKYMGDGMAAMWNAPIDVKNHPAQACRAALRMIDALDDLNKSWADDEELALPEIRIGIGMHTAEASVGNFGSEDHLEYSMLGDMVNLTARLESVTKQFGAQIIISSDTNARVGDFATVALGDIQVKGRSEATNIFALVGDEKTANTHAFQQFRDQFEGAVIAYRAGDGSAALSKLDQCRKGDMFGLGAAVEIFASRIRDEISG